MARAHRPSAPRTVPTPSQRAPRGGAVDVHVTTAEIVEPDVIATPSKAAIAGHPIHPMLIPFPFTLLFAALATDIAYWFTSDPFWARASLWLIGGGIVTALLAAVFGAIDFLSLPRVREIRQSWLHAGTNLAAVTLAAVSWFLRLDGAAEAIVPWGLALSAVVAAMLSVSGWWGGELSYRHGIGVNPRS